MPPPPVEVEWVRRCARAFPLVLPRSGNYEAQLNISLMAFRNIEIHLCSDSFGLGVVASYDFTAELITVWEMIYTGEMAQEDRVGTKKHPSPFPTSFYDFDSSHMKLLINNKQNLAGDPNRSSPASCLLRS